MWSVSGRWGGGNCWMGLLSHWEDSSGWDMWWGWRLKGWPRKEQKGYIEGRRPVGRPIGRWIICGGQGWKEDFYRPLPPGGNPIAVNKYIISYRIISYHIIWNAGIGVVRQRIELPGGGESRRPRTELGCKAIEGGGGGGGWGGWGWGGGGGWGGWGGGGWWWGWGWWGEGWWGGWWVGWGGGGWTATQLDEGEWKVEWKTDDLYTIYTENILYTLYH